MAMLDRLFASSAETGDSPKKGSLKTHYYRNDVRKIIESIEKMAKEIPGLKLIHVNQSQTEVSLEYRGKPFIFDVVLTLFKVNPIQHSIDIYASSRARFADFGGSEKLILKLYHYLDKNLSRAD
ncbi:MAG: hypothetical protein JWN30_2472 [Bacilli bacterium]|nr:hypothetical protein [Bacilli bacterium]